MNKRQPTNSLQGEEQLPWYGEFMETLLSFSTLSKLLRLFGATVIVAALSIYLMQGWQNGDDIQRFILLLAHTGLLALTGFLCGNLIKEPKGARLFLALGLISTSVCFSVLGGLIYSQVQWDVVSGSYPEFVTWRADSLRSGILTAAGAFTVLLPIVWLGFLALARRSATRLTFLFLVGNALLLLPVRSAAITGIALMALVSLILWLLSRTSQQDPTLNSTEGRFARLIQFLPIGIMAIRGLVLYDVDTFLMAAVAVTVFILLRQFALSMPIKSPWRRFVEQLSILPALMASIWITVFVGELSFGVQLLPVFAISFAGFIIEISLRSPSIGAGLRTGASAVVMLAMVGNLALIPSVISAIFCMLAGIAVVIYGFVAQQRLVLLLGFITLLVGIVYQLSLLVAQFDFSGWGALAALGITAIIIASVLERHGLLLKSRLSLWLREYRSWQY